MIRMFESAAPTFNIAYASLCRDTLDPGQSCSIAFRSLGFS